MISDAVAVFLGTLPLLGVMTWNMVETKSNRAELIGIRAELSSIRVPLAILEERDRLTHPVLKP